MSYKNENKSHFILFFASFFVPLRMDSAEAASRHFCKNKALTIIVVFRKSVGNFLSEYTTAPIMVGFICGKHR